MIITVQLRGLKYLIKKEIVCLLCNYDISGILKIDDLIRVTCSALIEMEKY